MVFVVGVEQGRMRAMGMREGAARSEFQAVPAVVTCPQSRLPICDRVIFLPSFYSLIYCFSKHMCADLRKKKKGMNLEEELG